MKYEEGVYGPPPGFKPFAVKMIIETEEEARHWRNLLGELCGDDSGLTFDLYVLLGTILERDTGDAG